VQCKHLKHGLEVSVALSVCFIPLFFPAAHVFFMKSIRLRPKPDAPASDDIFLANIASRPLCFLALALFLLLEFVEGVAFAFSLAFVCDGLGTPVLKECIGCGGRILLLDVGRGTGNRVTLLQDSHVYTMALLGFGASLFWLSLLRLRLL
jgi:hypothetical protein